MSIFGSIMSKIFGHKDAAAAPGSAPTPGTAPAAPAPGGAPAGTAPAANVDVGAVLTQMESQQGQQLNWRTSIVDLMKLVGLDSSLQNRQSLADELGYTGDKNDSASMNVWLHQQVMAKLAQNGGKVPDDLKN